MDSTRQAKPVATSEGSLADMLEGPSAPSSRGRFAPSDVAKVAVLAGLFTWLNLWQFRELVSGWRHDPNWSHGFLIPLFSLYLLYSRREELLAAPRRVCLWGLPIFVGGIVLSLLGFYPIGTHWISQLAMVATLFGLVLYLAGPAVTRYAWVPILYLALAMPIPTMLYTGIATPLQNLAASASTAVLGLMGVQMEATASNLKILSRTGHEYGLTVAEACSGMRSLLAYVALGVAWAYLEDRPLWQRVVLVVAAVPVAVVLNIARVTITAGMYVIDRPELGQKFMHEFMGMLMLAPALGLLWALSYLLRHLFVEEDSGQAAPAADAEESPK
jgi:exosortase